MSKYRLMFKEPTTYQVKLPFDNYFAILIKSEDPYRLNTNTHKIGYVYKFVIFKKDCKTEERIPVDISTTSFTSKDEAIKGITMWCKNNSDIIDDEIEEEEKLPLEISDDDIDSVPDLVLTRDKENMYIYLNDNDQNNFTDARTDTLQSSSQNKTTSSQTTQPNPFKPPRSADLPAPSFGSSITGNLDFSGGKDLGSYL